MNVRGIFKGGILDRFIGGSSKSFRNSYDAASVKRRLAGWRSDQRTINSILASDGTLLRGRARELSRNNPYAASAKESFAANLIGTGITPSSSLTDKVQRAAVMELWEDWVQEADADGITDFYGMQALGAHALFDAGEFFLRFRDRRIEDGLTVPLQLQLLEADMCPLELNEKASNGNDIINGVEFDLIGRRVAYWFWSRHPGEALLPVSSVRYVRVPAYQVLHVFHSTRPGQIRGVPKSAPGMLKLWLLDQYDDAELERKKVAALFAGFIKAPENMFETEEEPGEFDAPPNIALEPGTMQQLLPGEEVTFSNPADVGGAYEAFEYRQILAACAAMGAPYSIVTGDRRKANYSSERGGVIEYRRRLQQLQYAVVVFQLCRPVWQRWWQATVLSGAQLPGVNASAFTANPRQFTRARWIAPRFEWVDPYKDMQAELIAVRAGFKPLSDVIEGQGEDTITAFDRMEADAKELDARGLVLDSDPRMVSHAGLTQARPAGSIIPDPTLEHSDVIDTSGQEGQNGNDDDAEDAA
jgi:lambda family phage portal protein